MGIMLLFSEDFCMVISISRGDLRVGWVSLALRGVWWWVRLVFLVLFAFFCCDALDKICVCCRLSPLN